MTQFNLEIVPDTTDPEEIRLLARDKGYTAQRALRPHLWRLTRADGTPALDPVTRDTGFTFFDAIEFLKQEPDSL